MIRKHHKYLFCVLAFVLPLLSIAQKRQDKAVTFECGLNIYAEGRPLFFEPRLIPSLPITYANDLSFSVGAEVEWLFVKTWSIYTAVNYLYQQADWQAIGLTSSSDIDPILGPRPGTGSTSFDIRQRWHHLQIPLLFGYNTSIGSDRLTFLTGFSTELIIGHKGTGTVTEAGNTRLYTSSQISNRNIPLHWVVGIAYQKSITSKVVLGVRPTFSLVLRKKSILSTPPAATFGQPIRTPRLGVSVFARLKR